MVPTRRILRLAIVLGLLLTACKSRSEPPVGAGSGSAAAAATPTAEGGCRQACMKVLGCFEIEDDSQLSDCVTGCDKGGGQNVRAALAMSCDEIKAQMQQGAAPQGGTPAASGCTADCTGCVGDGTSCYAAAGGTHGIPCDDCCCAPGGPAPVWR